MRCSARPWTPAASALCSPRRACGAAPSPPSSTPRTWWWRARTTPPRPWAARCSTGSPEATGGREAGILKGRAMVGHDVVLAFRRLTNAPGWTVTVAEPLAAYEASWRHPLLALGAGGVASFIIALFAAAWLGRRILRPVRALARQAEAVAASGGVVPGPEGGSGAGGGVRKPAAVHAPRRHGDPRAGGGGGRGRGAAARRGGHRRGRDHGDRREGHPPVLQSGGGNHLRLRRGRGGGPERVHADGRGGRGAP